MRHASAHLRAEAEHLRRVANERQALADKYRDLGAAAAEQASMFFRHAEELDKATRLLEAVTDAA